LCIIEADTSTLPTQFSKEAFYFGANTEESAKGLAARIEGLNLESTGSFWHSNGEELPW
jgi:hypothetical protein